MTGLVGLMFACAAILGVFGAAGLLADRWPYGDARSVAAHRRAMRALRSARRWP